MSFLLKPDSNPQIQTAAAALLDAVEAAVNESVDLSAFLNEAYASRAAFLADVAMTIFVEELDKRHGPASGSYALARMSARKRAPAGYPFPTEDGL